MFFRPEKEHPQKPSYSFNGQTVAQLVPGLSSEKMAGLLSPSALRQSRASAVCLGPAVS